LHAGGRDFENALLGRRRLGFRNAIGVVAAARRGSATLAPAAASFAAGLGGLNGLKRHFRRRERPGDFLAANDATENAGNDFLAGEFVLIHVVGEDQRLQYRFGHVYASTRAEIVINILPFILTDDCPRRHGPCLRATASRGMRLPNFWQKINRRLRE
jgi:hypothetical protein